MAETQNNKLGFTKRAARIFGIIDLIIGIVAAVGVYSLIRYGATLLPTVGAGLFAFLFLVGGVLLLVAPSKIDRVRQLVYLKLVLLAFYSVAILMTALHVAGTFGTIGEGAQFAFFAAILLLIDFFGLPPIAQLIYLRVRVLIAQAKGESK